LWPTEAASPRRMFKSRLPFILFILPLSKNFMSPPLSP